MLKRTLATLIACSTMLSLSASALPLLDVKIGAEVFQADTTFNGTGYGGHDHLLGAYLALEHAVPVLPNVRVEMRQFNESGVSFKRRDATFYYQVLDNSVAKIDMGVGITRFDGKDGDDNNEHSPHVYAAAEAGLPFVNWSAFADGRALKYNDSQGYDMSMGVRWQRDMTASPVAYGLRAGYRIQDHSFDNVPRDIEMKHHGVFAGIDLSF